MTVGKAVAPVVTVRAWINRRTGRYHLGAQIGRGPFLTSEACQHDQAQDVLVKAIDDVGLNEFDPCHVCATPALEV